MQPSLSTEQIEELRAFCTPTVSNAIELFDVRPRTEGFMRPGLHCHFPEMSPIVGYAATATFAAQQPSATPSDPQAYDESVLAQPGPRISVAQDMDDAPIGALFGEVNSTVHKALGCVGHITNGGVRDLDEVREIGFQLISGCVQVAHAYVHVEDFAIPVQVGGVTVNPGDLLHADQHGFCIIPPEVAPHLAEACRGIEEVEHPLLELARSSAFTVAKYIQARVELAQELAALSADFAQRITSQ